MYQPTNVTPSTLTGDSTIDVADNVKITWQINGDTPLEAFQIDFYDNDATSTPIYSTGLLTDGCPASGVDGQGKPVLFTYEPSSTAWSTYGLTNGNEYKYNIKQFWNTQAYVGTVPTYSTGSGTIWYTFFMRINDIFYYYSEKVAAADITLKKDDTVTLNYDKTSFIVNYNTPTMKILPVSTAKNRTDFPDPSFTYQVPLSPYPYTPPFVNSCACIIQYSDNVFITRTAPTLTIDAFTTPLDKIVNTFTATYSQAEGDSVKWVRWELVNNTQSKTVADTGEINTYVFSYTYDGFMNDENYTLNCYTETENGVPVTASVTFDVSYQMPQAEGKISLLCNSDSSVTLSWAQASDITGIANNDNYSITDNVLTLDSGNFITWNTKNEQPLSIPSPQSIAYKGNQTSLIKYGYDIPTTMQSPIIAINPQGTLLVTAENTTAELYSLSDNGATLIGEIYMDGISQPFDGIIKCAGFSFGGKYLAIGGEFSNACTIYEVENNTLTFLACLTNLPSWTTATDVPQLAFVSNTRFVLSIIDSGEVYLAWFIITGQTITAEMPVGWYGIDDPFTYINHIPLADYPYAVVTGGTSHNGGIWLEPGSYFDIEDNGTNLTNPVTSACYIDGYLIAKTKYTNNGNDYAKLIFYKYTGSTFTYYYTLDTQYLADGFELNGYNNFIFTGDSVFEFRTDQLGIKLNTDTNTFTLICGMFKDNNNSEPNVPEVFVPFFAIGNSVMIAPLDNAGTTTLKYYTLNDAISNLTITNENAEIMLQRNIFNGISIVGSNATTGYSAYQPFGNFSEYIWQLYYNANWYLKAYSVGNNAINYSGQTSVSNYTPQALTEIVLNGAQTVDYVYVTTDEGYDITQSNYVPLYTSYAEFYANFTDGLQAGTNTTAAGNYAVYRELNSTSLLPFGLLTTTNQQMKDYGVLNNNTYSYSMYYVDNDTYSTPLYSDGVVCREFPAYVLMETTPDTNYSNVYHVLNVWCFGNNLEAQPVSNGNEPNFLENFTQYPYRQGSCVMALSGVLSGLLSNAHEGQYADTAEQMQRLYDISLSKNPFFLKDTKGNMYQVHTSSAITQTVNITTAKQEVKITIPWQEVGSAENVAVIQLPTDEGWTEEEGSESGIIKTQEKTVLLNMVNGDQIITPDPNYLLNGVTVKKPNTLQPSNILKDVNIGGVVGTLSKDVELQDKTVGLQLTSQSVTADAGYDGLGEVTVDGIQNYWEAEMSVVPNNTAQYITPPAPKLCIGAVKVNPVPDETKTVTVTDGTTVITPSADKWLSQVTVNVSRIEPKDYNFFDWDGTLVYSYTSAELNALTELPALPTHTGFTGEWNYTLANLKSLTTLTQPLPCNVGAIYKVKPQPTKTLATITIPEGDTKRDIDFTFPASAGGTFTVDWGDSSSSVLHTANGKISRTHTYSSSGTYDLTIYPIQGSNLTLDTTTSLLGTKTRQRSYLTRLVLGDVTMSLSIGSSSPLIKNCYNLKIFSFGNINLTTSPTFTPRDFFAGCNSLTAVHFPASMTYVNANAVRNCGVKVVTVGYNVTSFNFAAFSGDSALEFLTLPKSLTSLSNYVFGGTGIKELIFPAGVSISLTTSCQYMQSLEKIVLPTTMTTVPDSFLGLHVQANGIGAAIPYIYIPPTVTAFGNNAFNVRTNVEVMDFRSHTAVPTLAAATSAQANIYVVPDNLYSTWITATNWAGKASSIVKASDYND